jgi:FMN phosphatase YigB (HAD superfamily)
LQQIIKTILFDFGNTLVTDPFCEAIKSCQNEFEKIIKNGKYDLNAEMLIAVWKNIINKFMEPIILTSFKRKLF